MTFNIPEISNKTSESTMSLLSINKLDFDFERDIHDEQLLDDFWLWNIFIRWFEENGYAAIMRYVTTNGRQVEMWTGYAIATQEYLTKRAKMQHISPSEEGYIIWHTKTLDRAVSQNTSIYFLWSAKVNSGALVWTTYSKDDIDAALLSILTWVGAELPKINI